LSLQDRIAASVVGAISPQLEKPKMERASGKPTEASTLNDYFFWRAMARFYQWNRDRQSEALQLF